MLRVCHTPTPFNTECCANWTQENVRNGAAFRCVEAIGQAISYGMNTQTESDPLTGL